MDDILIYVCELQKPWKNLFRRIDNSKEKIKIKDGYRYMYEDQQNLSLKKIRSYTYMYISAKTHLFKIAFDD